MRRFSVRKMAVTGMLAAISILLGATRLGFIPIGPVSATIMHIPVIIGAIMEGPVVGAVVGLIFGGFSMYQALVMPTNPVQIVFLDPMVAIVPRVLIGLVSYGVYTGIKSFVASSSEQKGKGELVASAIAAALGTLTNTVGVLSMIYLRHAAEYAEKAGISRSAVGGVLAGIGLTNGIPEIIVAVLIVTAVVGALKKMYARKR